MKTSSVYSQANITQLGAIACSCLTSGQRGQVLAAFSKAIYLLSDAGKLFWITTEDVPMHQRCMQISSPLPQPSVGVPFHMEDHCLTIDPAFVFNLEAATDWFAPLVDPNHVLEIAQLSTRVQTYFSNLDLSQAEGFGNFIPHILSLSQNESIHPQSVQLDPVLLFAQPLVLGMARACIEHDSAGVSQNADALIGLGAGLTPSGDDFLGGLLFAMKILQAAYPDSNLIDHSIPVDSYRSRTHFISFSLLKDLASGHALAPMHHLINGLLSEQSLESIYPYVSQLTPVGHSTGWDMLTGMLAGLLTINQGYYLLPSFRTHQIIEA
jgi:hypothetical protein